MDIAIDRFTDTRFHNMQLYPKFQPIVSITKGKTIGFEGLIRGTAADCSCVFPKEIFALAHKIHTTLELDRKCREVILSHFSLNNENYPEYYLFLNIDTSILEVAEGSNYLYNQVLESGINPENIVIEICESKINDTDKLLRFVSKYKSLGFLVALDDLGTGFSSLERIPMIKPDIIKLDRSIIENIENESYKQVCLKSLVRLANNIGAIVVAEGIETEMEAYKALEYGAHLLQGYHFSRPEFLEQENSAKVEAKINEISTGFKKYMKKRIREDRNQKKKHENVIGRLLDELKNNSPSQFDLILTGFIESANLNQIECLYILNESGKQISNTVFYEHWQDNRKKLLFYPATVGTDHSLKEYYYYLANLRTVKFYSEPYISMATGNVCVTLTMAFKDSETKTNILCIDYKYN